MEKKSFREELIGKVVENGKAGGSVISEPLRASGEQNWQKARNYLAQAEKALFKW